MPAKHVGGDDFYAAGWDLLASPFGTVVMARWRVDYLGKKGSHLGTVEAASEREAIAEAANEFNVPPARQNKIAVTKIDERSR